MQFNSEHHLGVEVDKVQAAMKTISAKADINDKSYCKILLAIWQVGQASEKMSAETAEISELTTHQRECNDIIKTCQGMEKQLDKVKCSLLNLIQDNILLNTVQLDEKVSQAQHYIQSTAAEEKHDDDEGKNAGQWENDENGPGSNRSNNEGGSPETTKKTAKKKKKKRKSKRKGRNMNKAEENEKAEAEEEEQAEEPTRPENVVFFGKYLFYNPNSSDRRYFTPFFYLHIVLINTNYVLPLLTLTYVL